MGKWESPAPTSAEEEALDHIGRVLRDGPSLRPRRDEDARSAYQAFRQAQAGTLGTVAASSFPTNDYSAIRVSSSSAVQTGLVDRYSSGSDVRVTGSRSATTGLAVCRSGSTTGWHCGSVTATNQTVCYAEGCVGQMIRTNVCAEPGDSGGSLVTGDHSFSRRGRRNR